MIEQQNRTAVDFEAYKRYGEEMIERIGKNHPGYTNYRWLPSCKADERNTPTSRKG